MSTEKQKLTQEEIDSRIASAKERRRKPVKYTALPKGVKVSYFENPVVPNQRLTIVRRFNKQKREAEFAFSINNPPHILTEVSNKTKKEKVVTMRKEPGDVFCRKDGRQIALDRMNMPLVVTVVGDEYPLAACLRQIKDTSPEGSSLKLIASFWYPAFPGRVEKALGKLGSSQPEPAPYDCTKIVVRKPKPRSFLDKIMDFFRGVAA